MKTKGQRALILKEPLILCKLVMPIHIYTIGISHMKWGNNLLGGGLCASGAFLGMIQFNFIYKAPFKIKLSQDAIEGETLSMTSRLAKWQRKRSNDKAKS